MKRLFVPQRHEPLGDAAWHEDTVRAWITAFAAEACARYARDGAWPQHPRDREDGDATTPFTPLYHGEAGMLWALDALARRGFAAASPAAITPDLVARNLAEVEAARWGDESLLLGQSGVLLLAWRRDPTPRAAEAVAASVERNAAHPANEMLWGVPGTLHAAAALHEATGDTRVAAIWRAGARSVLASLHFDPELSCHVWTQDLYHRRTRYLGAGHGFAGNAAALLRAQHLLEADERGRLREALVDTMLRTAVRADGRANWPALPGDDDSRWLVQWCHGAPGVILSLAALDDARLDDVLVEAGELVFDAGPLEKGPGWCHGTAGNGFALLELHRRTGEPRWRERARRFAMHAIAQSDAAAAHHGARRYSLWTGDAGVALFAAACLDGILAMPPLHPEPL